MNEVCGQPKPDDKTRKLYSIKPDFSASSESDLGDEVVVKAVDFWRIELD
jgi:hypothetical protein